MTQHSAVQSPSLASLWP